MHIPTQFDHPFRRKPITLSDLIRSRFLYTDKRVIKANEIMSTALKSLSGMGWRISPIMLSSLGDSSNRFNSAEEIQNYADIAPVTETSGQKSRGYWRWQCAKFVRQTFVE